MCRDYERIRAWREHKALIDMEYERRRRPSLLVVSPPEGYEPNDFKGETTALTRPAPIVRMRAAGDGLEMVMANWWFVPSSFQGTYREFQRKLSTFNARSEGIAKSNTFRKAFAAQRCLVPASGWYEWTEPAGWKKGKPKTKWRFTCGDHEPLFFAGIWDRFENTDPAAPGLTDTFALITHEGGEGIDKYHDRAPIVLPADTWADWTDPGCDGPQALLPPASAANAYRVEYVSGPVPEEGGPL
jgi:putative SOS response-associated peptidase YedK